MMDTVGYVNERGDIFPQGACRGRFGTADAGDVPSGCAPCGAVACTDRLPGYVGTAPRSGRPTSCRRTLPRRHSLRRERHAEHVHQPAMRLELANAVPRLLVQRPLHLFGRHALLTLFRRISPLI